MYSGNLVLGMNGKSQVCVNVGLLPVREMPQVVHAEAVVAPGQVQYASAPPISPPPIVSAIHEQNIA